MSHVTFDIDSKPRVHCTDDCANQNLSFIEINTRSFLIHNSQSGNNEIDLSPSPRFVTVMEALLVWCTAMFNFHSTVQHFWEWNGRNGGREKAISLPIFWKVENTSKKIKFLPACPLYYLCFRYDCSLGICQPLKIKDPPGEIVALASFPGSGNTWTRHLLQQATGKISQTQLSFINCMFPGFKTGDIYAKFDGKDRIDGIYNGSVIAVKTHQHRIADISYFKKAIIVVR